MQIGADDAEPGAQIEHVPAVGSEEANGRSFVSTRQRPVFVRQQVDERRLAGAVRPDHGRVLAGADCQADAVEDRGAVLDNGGVRQLENGRGVAQWPPV
jgi:hypothetical protein